MTLDEFAAVTAKRVPTAEELVAFVRGQGWRLAPGPNASVALLGGEGDPLADKVAQLLGREPYRSEVYYLVQAGHLSHLQKVPPAPPPAPPPEAVSEVAPPRLRQWRWPSGHVQTEEATWASVGRADGHPHSALWWRWLGEDGWKVIPGREALAQAAVLAALKNGRH